MSAFTRVETEALIDAIDHLKVLDPTCSSGAFPIGMRQKLVHILRKLDPDNRGWRRRQEVVIEQIESLPAREDGCRAIERAFAHDNDDYGRKLYLIEKCLYGVDIQPIACQIAKLRVFHRPDRRPEHRSQRAELRHPPAAQPRDENCRSQHAAGLPPRSITP